MIVGNWMEIFCTHHNHQVCTVYFHWSSGEFDAGHWSSSNTRLMGSAYPQTQFPSESQMEQQFLMKIISCRKCYRTYGLSLKMGQNFYQPIWVDRGYAVCCNVSLNRMAQAKW